MKERTVTEHVEPAVRARGKNPVPGLLVVFVRSPVEIRGVPVTMPIVVGRDDEASLQVDDAASSRTHARISPSANGFLVEDLGSRNGTFVNAVAVPETGVTARPGSVIRLGGTLLMVAADVSPYLNARPPGYRDLVGGAALDDVRARIRTIAGTTSPVLVLGETGTGKEVVARVLHEQSGRKGELVALNCAAVPAELMDAELFGHARGAFSGASGSRVGLFRTAAGGTLFLDEVAELPAPLQAKLLRVLETSEVRPVGEDRNMPVDVRVVTATNGDVDQMVRAGSFRGDLLYRLAGLRITLPPLRDRIEDVPLLASRFFEPLGVGATAAALERLMLCAWPGNVRELRHAIAAAAAVCGDRAASQISSEDLEAAGVALPRVEAPSAPLPQADGEVHAALRAADGNVALAAERLGMSRSALYERLRKLGVNAKTYRRNG